MDSQLKGIQIPFNREMKRAKRLTRRSAHLWHRHHPSVCSLTLRAHNSCLGKLFRFSPSKGVSHVGRRSIKRRFSRDINESLVDDLVDDLA